MDPSNDRIREWRAERGLVPIATVLLALVALGARTCGEAPTLALYPVELIDPAPDDPFDVDPLFAPAPLDCDPCRERTLQLVGGDRVTIRSASKPGLVLHREDVDFLELSGHGLSAQADDGHQSEPVERAEVGAKDSAAEWTATVSAEAVDRFAVYAVLGTTGREAWTAFAVEHARQVVLVELDGRPVDLIRPLGWSRGLRVGVFETEARRTAYLQTIPFSSARGAPYEP